MYFVITAILRTFRLVGFLCLVWCMSGHAFAVSVRPVAQQGVLDLRKWDFSQQGTLPLQGAWFVYWKKLLSPQQVASHQPDGMLPIPQLWNGAKLGQLQLQPDGYATYRLTLLLAHSQTVSLRINRIYSSYKLFVNGELLWTQGAVGTNADSTTMRVGPHIVSFSAKHRIELLLQIANFSHRKGGPSDPIEMGTQEQLLRERLLRISLDTIVFGMLFLMSLFFFVFNVFTTHRTSTLAFAVGCLLVACRLLIVNEGVLTFALQHISYTAFLRLEYLLVYGYVIVAFHFLRVTYSQTFAPRITQGFQIYWGLLFVLTLFTTPWIYTRLLWAFTMSSPVVILFLFYSLGRGLYYQHPGIYHLLIGVLCAAFGSIYDIWSYSVWEKTTIDFGPVGLLVMAATQTIFLVEQTRRQHQQNLHTHVPFLNTQTMDPAYSSNPSHPRVPVENPKKTLQGQQIQGWILLRMLGEGGMSVVYEAIHPQTQQRAALKLIHTFAAPNPTRSKRFQREARIMQRIQHPNVLKVYDCGTDPELGDYMILELLEGQDLQEVMFHHAPLPLSWLNAIVEQLCMALRATHAEGVIHRDLKPSNIFLLPTGVFPQVKLLDYGIAKEQDQVSTKLTSTGAIIGTPAYLAPEQLGSVELTPATDIYALGVILFEALTRELPLQEESMAKLLLTLLQKPATLLGQFRPEFRDTPLEALLAKMMSKEPTERYATIDEFWQEWQNVCSATLDPLDLPEKYPNLQKRQQEESAPFVPTSDIRSV